MGTYTTNYNLFMPSIGEQGWGELVNGNFSTIDTTMKGLNTRMGTAETNITSLTSRMGTAEPIITSNTSRIGTLETETNAVKNRVTTVENKLGSGTYIGNTTVPIYVKLSTTDQGYGWVSYGESYRTLSTGYVVANPTSTFSASVSLKSGANGSGTVITFYAINLISGASRTLGTMTLGSYNTTKTQSYTLYVTEYFQIGGYDANAVVTGRTVTAPRIYINTAT